ncbi:MAG: alpha/beta fold hydrolase [Candidatus Omnitrophica bacterium]|nr:alpha/beta fold hydrolase [Candidatus Omnitrophota bacterium]MDD5670414.1 alpha/beta fold hydrolase [Candidatus Omnitrophota bacterium]
MHIVTEDAHRIAIDHRKTGHPEVVVLAHGFYNNKDAYLFRAMAERLARDFDVVSFDFRGHGQSEGLFSWTSRECLDLKAVVSYARDQGYPRVGVIGFSLGAAIVLIEAGQNRLIDSAMAVSAPCDFWKIDFHFWEKEMLNDLRLNLGPKGKGKGIRPGNPFLPKVRPIDVVERISPTPVLFVHGAEDWLIKPSHSERLFKAAKEPKEIAVIPGAGHAEKIFDSHPDEFERICVHWFQKTLQSQRVGG